MLRLQSSHLRSCSLARSASTSAGPFPFPVRANPTPHQIFHLPVGASQKDIKARYYELVRIHHPDSPLGPAGLSPAERRARFHAITSAYDVLRGRRAAAAGRGGPGDMYREELNRRRRAYAGERARRSGPFAHGHSEWNASADDRWKDRLILFVGIMAIGAGLGPALLLPSYSASYQAHVSAARNLAQARKDAREFGEERRKEIRKRVEEYEKEKELQDIPQDRLHLTCPSSRT